MIEHGATIVHHIPGRLRVRLPRASRRPDILRDLHVFIAGLGGVRQVEINPVTGSILVHYAPESADQIQNLLASQPGLNSGSAPELDEVDDLAEKIEKEAEFLAVHSELALFIVNNVKALNGVVRGATDNAVDLKVLLPAGLAVWAFFKHGVEASTPLWVSLAIFSVNSFMALHRPTHVRVSQHVTEVAQPSA
jgi:hypothetical protein